MRKLFARVLAGVLAAAMLAAGPATAAAERNGPLYQRCVEEKAALLEDLGTFVNIDSGTAYEPGLKKFQELLIDRLRELGAEVTYQPVDKPQAGYNIVATFRGTGKGKILLLTHADTVYAAGTAEKRPFRMDEKRAYGPGVSDEKGGIALALHALTVLRAMGFDNFAQITWMINPDEEQGSRVSREQIMRLAKEHAYTLCIEPGISGDAVMNWRKGIRRLTVEVFGRNAHAGIEPEKGRNATLELAHQIVLMSKLGDAAKMTTVNWTWLERTKTPINVIPDYAFAQADVRVLDPAEFDRILKEAQTLSQTRLVPDTKVKVSMSDGRPPFNRNFGTDTLVARMQKIYADELGMTLRVQGSGGGSDANYAAIAGAVAVDGLGLVGGNDHTPDEYVELDSVVPRLYLLTRTLMLLGEGKQ